MYHVLPERVRALNSAPLQPGAIIYWMNRDQRAHDNWALLYAAERALTEKRPLQVVFCLTPHFLGATWRAYSAMLTGLRETEKILRTHHIPFIILLGAAPDVLPTYLAKHQVGGVVTDFSPLRLPRAWREQIAKNIKIPLYEVDAHNIVPCWIASPKQEYGAYTLRPKITKLLPHFLEAFPLLPSFPEKNGVGHAPVDWEEVVKSLKVDRAVLEVTSFVPGERAAHECLKTFIHTALQAYDEARNDPNCSGQSGLSPYLHFGQISAQRVALEINKLPSSVSTQAFLEELIVRRELADNFCYYNPKYDTVEGFPEWAKKNLEAHKADPREYMYTETQFEQAHTHDELWNAAQRQLVTTGKMHGYMRMYWAKKILEWTPDAATAMRYAIYLNDRYELDGRDPNGYAGIAWSIGGVHDRAWFTRPVFGTIRYMNARGAAGKFDVAEYIRVNTG
jgi:deoxyribodipyrimidine photo-lyase